MLKYSGTDTACNPRTDTHAQQSLKLGSMLHTHSLSHTSYTHHTSYAHQPNLRIHSASHSHTNYAPRPASFLSGGVRDGGGGDMYAGAGGGPQGQIYGGGRAVKGPGLGEVEGHEGWHLHTSGGCHALGEEALTYHNRCSTNSSSQRLQGSCSTQHYIHRRAPKTLSHTFAHTHAGESYSHSNMSTRLDHSYLGMVGLLEISGTNVLHVSN